MLLSCYYIGDRLRDDEKAAMLAEARTAYMAYKRIYLGVHSILDRDILELHGEVITDGLSSNSLQYCDDVRDNAKRTCNSTV